jgi:tetratricopeptide (TPR) repeat protein
MALVFENNIKKALHAHKTGNLKEAEELYLKCITISPNDSNGWYLYGALCQQIGKTSQAKKYIDRSIKLTANFPEALNIRGILHKKNGQIRKAEHDFRTALSLDPTFPEAMTNLADTCRLTGNYIEARRLNNKAIKLAPGLAPAYNNRGAIEKELGNLETAEIAFRAAIDLDASLIDAVINLIIVLRLLGQTDIALKRAIKTVKAVPKYALAHNSLGLVYYDMNRNNEARDSFQRACANDPNCADAHNNLGITLTRLDHLSEANHHYGIALALDPKNPSFLSNKAANFQAENNVGEAIRACNTALRAEPNHADARWNRGLALLLSGDLIGGFADYEARWLLPEFKNRSFRSKLWQNEDLKEKSILIYSEQGFGDTIQFIRYVSLLAKQKPKAIYLETHKPLVNLLKQNIKINRVVTIGDDLPKSDYHIPVMSLAHRFKTTLEDIPKRTPYIDVTERTPYIFEKNQRKQKKIKIGLVWAGRKSHKNNKNRSIPLNYCVPFFQNQNIHFYSLQVDGATECKKHSSHIIDLSAYLTDFVATGAILKNLDLVITVDTALAHLAGALGVKCWIMLPFAPDWRWQLDKHYTPWYSSVRLFRQQERNDWKSVVDQITSSLAEFHATETGTKNN